ncbi:MAG: SCO family protein [Rhodanobacteraceae bacterium]|nr:MAG: SCO family protein [Rhodanobacteraceae bacterium]
MTVLRTLLASLAILVAGIAVLAFSTDGFRAYTTETARRIDVRTHPRPVPPLVLQAADGTRTSFAALRGRWLLVDFIYTRCTTYCSVQGGEFANLQRWLAGPIAAGKVTLVSVSFDPRDEPAQLAGYQRRFGDSGTGWVAVRAVASADRAVLMRVFGVTAVADGLGGFVHNAAINVVNPDGKLVAILDWDDPRAAARYITRRLTP